MNKAPIQNNEPIVSGDTTIAAEITDALQEDSRTDMANIEVINERGVVTLEGYVDSEEARSAAEEIARAQLGVISVVNALRINQ